MTTDAYNTSTHDSPIGLNIESIPVEQINPAPYNPRKDLQPGDPDYEKLRRSIVEFGCVEPLVWNRRTENLVGGHQRLKVLRAQGATKVDVSVVDLSPVDEKALNLALNRISGEWDPRKLAQLIDELTSVPDFDVGLTGFDVPEMEELLDQFLDRDDSDKEEQFDIEAELAANRPPVTEPGELIELGPHRLLCSDSTDPQQVRRLMDGQRAILFHTDPPYCVGYDGMNHPGANQKRMRQKFPWIPGPPEVKLPRKVKRQREAAKNKDWSQSYGVTWDDAEANPELYEGFIRVAIDEAIEPNAAWYCWHASKRQAMVEAVWEKFGAFVHQQIIWVKDRPILTRSWYFWQHEPCFFGWVKGRKPPRRRKDYPSTIWQIPTVPVGQKTEHPTSKPLSLFEIPMLQHTVSSPPNDLCYEPFAGSGSQLIAAERLGRRCYAIEISPQYCDVIVRRYIAFVGEAKVPPELAERYQVTEQKIASTNPRIEG